MKDALLNSDIHNVTTSGLFGIPLESVIKNTIERYLGKQSNHSLSYGEGYSEFVRNINKKSDDPPYLVLSLNQGKEITENWHGLYPTIRIWHVSIQQELNRFGNVLTTPYGFKRKFHGHWGPDLWKSAYAFKPQSTVADHFAGCVQPDGVPGGLLMIKEKRPDVKLINQSHDSFLAEVDERGAEDTLIECISYIRRPMTINDETFTIPVDGEIGERWGELDKYE